MSETRSRSASPARKEPRPKKQKTSGFKWKEKKNHEDDTTDGRNIGRLQRGYRDRSPIYRDHFQSRDRLPRRGPDDVGSPDRDPRGETDSYRPRDWTQHRDPERSESKPKDTPKADQKESRPTDKADKPKKEKKPKPSAPSEPMIIVNINDRLGTKAAIPCLASDSIKAFKAVVAAHIGRQPHEIMLKRQGERPFKDQLTLQDYGVSNGVQLDLELDTGD